MGRNISSSDFSSLAKTFKNIPVDFTTGSKPGQSICLVEGTKLIVENTDDVDMIRSIFDEKSMEVVTGQPFAYLDLSMGKGYALMYMAKDVQCFLSIGFEAQPTLNTLAVANAKNTRALTKKTKTFDFGIAVDNRTNGPARFKAAIEVLKPLMEVDLKDSRWVIRMPSQKELLMQMAAAGLLRDCFSLHLTGPQADSFKDTLKSNGFSRVTSDQVAGQATIHGSR